MLQNKTILVIGGVGFVGSNLCSALLKYHPNKIVVVDNLLSSDLDNLPMHSKIEFVLGSIADDRILQQIGLDYDYVFHLATYHGNQSSIANPIADHQNNMLTTLKLCEHFKNHSKLTKLVYASAGCSVAKKTFDNTKATTEEDPVSLYHDSPYQISKIVGEFYGNYYWKQYQLPFVKARFQNVYGPREVLGAGSWRGTKATVWRNVTPTFIWKSLHQEALPLEKGGIASRDFIYVDDIVNGLIACAISGEAGEVYNLASGCETTIKELAELINRLTQNTTDVALKAARDWDNSGKRFGAPDKTFNKLGFKAEVDLATGLKHTIEWTKANRERIARSIEKHSYFMDQP